MSNSVNSDNSSWTAKVRAATVEKFEPEDLLPDHQPAYVASWIYVFGVLTIAALAMIILSGFYLSLIHI